MKKVLYFLFALILFINSCKKPGSNVPNYPVDADLKAAFSFKPGTYWIYIDSLSGEIDSFAVTYFNTTRYPDGNGLYTYDIITSAFTEYNTTNQSDTNNWGFSLERNGLYLHYDVGSQYLYGINYAPIIYPFSIGVTQNYTIDDITTYSYSGNTFDSVAIAYYSQSVDDYFYISSQVGMVKIVLNHSFDTLSRVWELQRWKIIK